VAVLPIALDRAEENVIDAPGVVGLGGADEPGGVAAGGANAVRRPAISVEICETRETASV
jgi:hypothetical protein